MTNSCNETYLVVDDDAPFRERLLKALRSRGFLAEGAASAEEAVTLVKKEKPSRVILDLKMPGESGLECLRAIKKMAPDTAVVMLTGYGSIATAMDAVREGAVHYLTKPVAPDAILAGFEKTAGEPSVTSGKVPVPSLPEVEWNHIQRVLEDCEGNISKAAKMLGLHRRSLQRKLKSPPRM